MASGVNVKMGVSGVAQFKQGMKESQAAVKNLDQQLKLNEQQLKLNGDAETYLQNKSKLLEEQIRKQQDVVRQAEAALKSMRDNGVSATSVEFQKMQQASYASQTELLRMRTELQSVGQSAEEAETGVGSMNEELANIGAGIGWQNVTSGIDKITGALETAAKAAYRMGRAIVGATLNGGQWADELATEAEMYEMTPEQLWRMQQTANMIDTEADTIISARKKLITAMGKDTSKETMGAFAALGISNLSGTDENIEDIFWSAGEALMKWDDKVERNEYAMKLYGKSWEELIPIFKAGRQTYEETMSKWTWVGDEQFENLTKLDDASQELNSEWESIKRQFEGTMAGVMQPVMETLTGLLREFNTYLQSDEGQKMLESLGETISSLFEDLENIKPEDVINGIKDALNGVKDALDWIKKNKDTIVSAIKGIALAFLGMKVVGLGASIMQMFSGFNGIIGGNGTPTGTGTDTVVPTGAKEGSAGKTGGTFFSGLLNKLTLFATANEVHEATEGATRKVFDEYMANAERMDSMESSILALMHDLGMTREEAEAAVASESRTPFQGNWALNDPEKARQLTTGVENMSEVAGEMTGEIGETRQANAEMTAAAKELSAMPEQMASIVERAIVNGMSQVTIVIDDRGVDALGSSLRGRMGDQISVLIK